MRNVDQLDIRDADGGAVLPVKVVPGSSRDKIVGVLGGAIKVATSAPPEKGKANKAVARILAKALNVDARTVSLQGGASSPHKEFAFKELRAAGLRNLLAKL